MEEKKKPNYLKYVFILLFIIYISLYILNYTGYYDANIKKRVAFTNSQIETFEKDVSEGKNVDINDYLKDQNKNYTNKTSRFGYMISTSTEKILTKGLKNTISFLSKFFT